jgi:hypothetical protein
MTYTIGMTHSQLHQIPGVCDLAANPAMEALLNFLARNPKTLISTGTYPDDTLVIRNEGFLYGQAMAIKHIEEALKAPKPEPDKDRLPKARYAPPEPPAA